MKTARKNLFTQRSLVEKKLHPWAHVHTDKVPNSGWIKAVRGALGMTARQLAQRMGVTQSNITRLEARERSGTVTLELMERTARAMNCRFVYAVVPDDRYRDLSAIVDEQAKDLATQLVRRTEHSMRLEKQGANPADLASQVDRVAQELKTNMDSRIWSPRTPTTGQKT